MQTTTSRSVVRHRKLGNTGYDVSTIGFGTWQIGGGRWAAPDFDERVELLRSSLELGVNIYDAAVVYGQYTSDEGRIDSRSQELLGAAFEDRRDRVIYCIKIGQFDEYTHRSLYEPARLVEQFRQSLRRLRTDFVDICLIHAPTLHDVQQGKALAVVQTLQALGMVRAVGYSFEAEPEHVMTALEQRVDVLMLQYNLLDSQCGPALAEAARRGVGVLVGGPFKRGYISGRFRSADDLPLDDDYWAWNMAKNPAKVQALLDRSAQLQREYGSPAALRKAALDFIFEQPAAASAIVGHRELDEVVENLRAVATDSGPSELPSAGVVELGVSA
ncbi:MAG: aldo/keto reductase [Deltaproteobacteria bacterium]|nr:aldo/keto reductase [Deltaproteobacteria bacterium]